MSEKEDPGKSQEEITVTKALLEEVVTKAAKTAVKGVPTTDGVIAQMQKEGIQLKTAVTEEDLEKAIEKYMEKQKAKQEGDKPEEEKEGEHEEEKQETDDPDKEPPKTTDEYEMKASLEVAKLQGEMKSLKETMSKVSSKMDEERDKARNAESENDIPDVFKVQPWRVDICKESPIALRWKDIPTRTGIGAAIGKQLIKKADTLDAQDVAGHPVSSTPVWRLLVERVKIANMFDTIAVGEAGKFKITQLIDKAFVNKTDYTPPENPSAPANNIEEQEVTIKEYSNNLPVTFAQAEDTQGIPSQVEIAFMQQYGDTLDKEAFTSLKGASTPNYVNTGTAGALPAASAIFGKLLELRQAVDIPYQDNGVFILNRDIERILLLNYSNSGQGYAWNPFTQDALSQMLGAPVVVSARLDDTSTATDGEICAMFGDWSVAAVLGERVNLTIWQDSQTPGYNTWRARGRYGIGVRTVRAYSMMRVGA